jgi:hypothetical protein
MIHGGLQLGIMSLICLIYGGIGIGLILGGNQGDDKVVGAAFVGVMAFVFLIAALFLLPQLLGGWKLYREKPNARNWGIAGSILACLSFPLGTAAGVYGLWFLFGEEGKRFYLGGQPDYRSLPPDPGGWQQ